MSSSSARTGGNEPAARGTVHAATFHERCERAPQRGVDARDFIDSPRCCETQHLAGGSQRFRESERLVQVFSDADVGVEALEAYIPKARGERARAVSDFRTLRRASVP